MLSAVLVVLGLALVFLIARTLRQASALKDFGGEWSTSYSRLWLLWANGSGKMNTVFTAVNDKYGRFSTSYTGNMASVLRRTSPSFINASQYNLRRPPNEFLTVLLQ